VYFTSSSISALCDSFRFKCYYSTINASIFFYGIITTLLSLSSSSTHSLVFYSFSCRQFYFIPLLNLLHFLSLSFMHFAYINN
jgi:hypothetical protein